MKHIQLHCATRGAKYGDILPVGGKGNISKEDAQILVDEKMAVEYTAPIESGSDDKALKAKVTELEEKNQALDEELVKLLNENKVLEAKVTELQAIVNAVNANGAKGN